ncbi:MAG: hypothetical protein AAGB00_03890 [Planctomycetota bacterium]
MPRRTVCRALFLLLCLAPTLAVGGWTVFRELPGADTQRLVALGDCLGLLVSADAVATPRPSVVRLRGVRLSDPELGDGLARCGSIETRPGDGGLFARIDTLRIDAERLPRLAASFEQRLRGNANGGFEVWCDRLIVADGGAEQVWRRVKFVLDRPGGDRGQRLFLQATGTNASEPLCLTVTRNRQIEPPTTRVTLQTGGEGVPADWLGQLCPLGSAAGSDSRFVGQLALTVAKPVSGTLAGSWHGVNPAPLIGLPASTLGLARGASIDIKRLCWTGEMIEELRATVEAGPGAADRSVVFAAHRQLGLPAGSQLHEDWQAVTGTPIAFDRLAFSVALDATGLRVRGATIADHSAMPSVLSRGPSTLLYEPTEQRLPLASLVRFVAPPDAPLRPTSQAVDALARWLPAEQPSAAPVYRAGPTR